MALRLFVKRHFVEQHFKVYKNHIISKNILKKLPFEHVKMKTVSSSKLNFETKNTKINHNYVISIQKINSVLKTRAI